MAIAAWVGDRCRETRGLAGSFAATFAGALPLTAGFLDGLSAVEATLHPPGIAV